MKHKRKWAEDIKTLIDTYSHQRGSGSPEAQIVVFTRRITALTEHLQSHPDDHSTRRGLLRLVSSRRRQLAYLGRTSPDRYRLICSALGIRTSDLGEPSQSERDAANKFYISGERLLDNRKIVHLDHALRDRLQLSAASALIKVLVRVEAGVALTKELLGSGAVVQSRIGDYHEIQLSVDRARSLAKTSFIKAMSLMEVADHQSVGLEDIEHDEVGSVHPEGHVDEDVSPLRDYIEANRAVFQPGKCQVMVIDAGFNLSSDFYSNQFGNRISSVWSLEGKEAIEYNEIRGQLGEGDHGDRVSEIVLKFAPHVELIIVNRQPGLDLHNGVYALMVGLRKSDGLRRGCPLIVNLSFGTNLGSHDGESEMEREIQDFVCRENAGSYLVKSAGNEGKSNVHVRLVAPADRVAIAAQLEVKEGDLEILSFWHDSKAVMQYWVELPDGQSTSEYYEVGNRTSWRPRRFNRGGATVTMRWTAHPNGQCELRIDLKAGDEKSKQLPPGVWRVMFRAAPENRDSSSPLEIRGWLNRTSLRGSRFLESQSAGTVTLPGTGYHVLTVTGDDFAHASCGPTYSTVNPAKPEIALPAFSQSGGVLKEGTSFAAPRLTGCLAILLSARPSLKEDGVRKLLRKACDERDGVNQPAYGALNYKKFVSLL